jgi:acetyl esterase/lipase
MRRIYLAVIFALIILTAADAREQTLNIWPGIAPGSEDWKQRERIEPSMIGSIAYNVVTPTITAFLPKQDKATGTAVIIAPGGAFKILSIDQEGTRVAQWLKGKGIAAFVLKYRLIETPLGFSFGGGGAGIGGPGMGPGIGSGTGSRTGPGMGPERGIGGGLPGRGAAGQGAAGPRAAGPGVAGPGASSDIATTMAAQRLATADGIQALKVVREHAAEWGIDPNKVGFMGFSAGGVITAATLLQQDAALRPNFAAPIYGAPFGSPPIPAGLPPIFLAWAQDDTLMGPTASRFHKALLDAGYTPETHIYKSGGHGFGMAIKGTDSDHWIDHFYHWLETQGFTKK